MAEAREPWTLAYGITGGLSCNGAMVACPNCDANDRLNLHVRQEPGVVGEEAWVRCENCLHRFEHPLVYPAFFYALSDPRDGLHERLQSLPWKPHHVHRHHPVLDAPAGEEPTVTWTDWAEGTYPSHAFWRESWPELLLAFGVYIPDVADKAVSVTSPGLTITRLRAPGLDAQFPLRCPQCEAVKELTLTAIGTAAHASCPLGHVWEPSGLTVRGVLEASRFAPDDGGHRYVNVELPTGVGDGDA